MVLSLEDRQVAVAGDWHGSATWAGRIIPAIHRHAPEVRTILHVGDFWADRRMLDSVDYWSARVGIERVLVTLGNHEIWAEMTPLLAGAAGRPVQLSQSVFVLPRPCRFLIGGTTFLSLGGAASVDREWRAEGVDWWPDEQVTDEMVAAAIVGGAADVMITHESPQSTPVEPVRELIANNPQTLTPDAAAYSRASRHQIETVWNTVRPALVLHGHMHAAGTGQTKDGRRVVSLGCDGQAMNVVVVDTEDLSLKAVQLR